LKVKTGIPADPRRNKEGDHMRIAAVIGRKGQKWTLLTECGSNIDHQLGFFKKLRMQEGEHAGNNYDEAVMLTSDGLWKRSKFRQPAPMQVVRKEVRKSKVLV
jgi:hypothetical protein